MNVEYEAFCEPSQREKAWSRQLQGRYGDVKWKEPGSHEVGVYFVFLVLQVSCFGYLKSHMFVKGQYS